MAKKYKTIRETVDKDREDLEGNLQEVVTTLIDWRSRYGNDARIEIDTYDDYGCGVGVKIRYDRLENDDERTKRLADAKKWREKAAKNKAEKEEKEKARLVDLINKYGVPGEKSS